ncbi:family 43 glycosylhydrolase [Anaeromicropila populeti]|uniref:Glycosyl hydrolases family 43 n=1 Tax=Anaeromicropila populeti TaxID=37658 RepID=A0A1I6JN59_9FIRM|nr:family 43 glycosylhydrolase [Anaeromicropila populeti]SFR79980.1 Glycosyl hydrolases family 43 [Anaeromicropila populeti]
MPNPYLPNWEYIPDGEPRVFGDRVYVYGSHDSAGSDKFCDFKLKVWSASVHNLSDWICHGDIFHTQDDRDHKSDTDWTDHSLFAPDVVKKGDSYYLYAYIVGARGCVAVSDKPEGPFKLISTYQYNIPEGKNEEFCGHGSFIDPGVLVDDDGRVYIYCGYLSSYMAELNSENMYEVIDGTYQDDIIPVEAPFEFFEACSPRKVGDTYYLIYSPKTGSRLVYATSKSPTGPFTYGGTIVDNGIDYPGGNNHGSICKINGQWYIFYHRMTNGTIMSRRGCVERIDIMPDGTIPQVEMTSLGFEEALSPYQITPADIACVLKGGCIITEKNIFTRIITNITSGCIIGFKYFDFGEDFSSKTMEFSASIIGSGCKSKLHIFIDHYENGEEIGCCNIGLDDNCITTTVRNVTGRHAVFFVVEDSFGGYFTEMFKGRQLFELISFVFSK